MERDVEKDVTAEYMVTTLRRLADALEAGESFRIQVAGKRFTAPKDAMRLVEHEVEGDHHELSFELQWEGPGDSDD